ncbi:MAG: thiaminase II [Alphaproteobacteria bacterium]|nr:thiaminase II [Alphaproteobacteria bacterium]
MSAYTIKAGSLFDRLRAGAEPHWSAYTRHAFVAGLGDGSLPEAAFRHYLQQDFIFLKHFARAYALAVYKSDTLEDMRASAGVMDALLDHEMGLHIKYCAEWGISEADLEALDEDPACMAYTRYVLERGMAGDLLDLKAALAPCVVGYGEIAARLVADPDTKTQGNPYMPWIEMYSGSEYIDLAVGTAEEMDALWRRYGNDVRAPRLQQTFTEATRLEVGFWQMGLDALTA